MSNVSINIDLGGIRWHAVCHHQPGTPDTREYPGDPEEFYVETCIPLPGQDLSKLDLAVIADELGSKALEKLNDLAEEAAAAMRERQEAEYYDRLADQHGYEF